MYWLGVTVVLAVGCQADDKSPSATTMPLNGRPWKLICLGDGLTAGTGLKPIQKAYPACLAELLSTDKKPVKVVNAGLKGENLRAAAARLPWMFQQRFDALLIAMGQAELSQQQNLDIWTDDWDFLLRKVREIDPEINLFVTVLVPRSPSGEYVQAVQAIASKHAAVYLDIPLSEWSAEPDYWLRQGEDLYCSAAGQLWLAERLAKHFEKIRY